MSNGEPARLNIRQATQEAAFDLVDRANRKRRALELS
jgi:hypothetical protein